MDQREVQAKYGRHPKAAAKGFIHDQGVTSFGLFGSMGS